MRAGLAVVGVLILLAGAVFVGQGLGYIPGSFMTGDIHWFWIGSVMAPVRVSIRTTVAVFELNAHTAPVPLTTPSKT